MHLPIRTNIKCSGGEDLEQYALKHGRLKYIIGIFGEGEVIEKILKVKTIDFRLSTSNPRSEDCAFSQIEGLSSYEEALFKHPYGMIMITRGLQFNVPIDGQWISKEAVKFKGEDIADVVIF